jgi:dolichyl-phosphate-mannose--protein O-mannosyl transferase
LATSGGWLRDWGQTHPGATSVKVLGPDLASLLQYNKAIWDFHNGDFINNATHSYAAHPAGWLILARPIAIDSVNDIQPGTAGCSGPETCVQVVIGIGTPILWWGALIALIFAALLWVGGRDWRFGIPVVGALGAWLPWFAYTDRPLFFFYAITIIPFSVMALALCIGWLLGPADGPRRRVAAIGAGAFVALVAANFAYLYPVLTDEVITRTAWVARMWFRTWI